MILTAVPVSYRCRVCKSVKPIYVKPLTDDDGNLTVDGDGRHRLAASYCNECAEHRMCVLDLQETVAGDALGGGDA